MKEYKVYFRNVMNILRFKLAIRRKIGQINVGQYVSIKTKFMINGDTYPTLSLGEKFFLDLSSESDKSFYISYLLEKYNSDYINKYETSKITGIYLEVLKTTKDNYTAFIDDLNCQKNFFYLQKNLSTF